jgi:pyridoxal phosphate enzyme (YggS family)
MSAARRDELSSRLQQVRGRVDSAARLAGRSPDEVTLVVIAKTWPASDVRILCDLGVRDVGENRVQELEAKAGELADLPLTWHFVGQIQSNKAARIPAYASVVHSVSSPRVVARLNAGAHRHDRSVDCFVQVSLDDDGSAAGRGGAPPDEVERVASDVESTGRLRLAGFMGVAPLGADPVTAFERLAQQATDLRSRYPSARQLSAGMSVDFEAAISAGATHVRVGSAILGERPANR